MTLKNWLKKRRQLVIKDEDNFAEKKTISYSNGKMLAVLVPALFLVFLLSFWMASSIISNGKFMANFDKEMKKQIISLSQTVDSLHYEIEKNEQYYKHFKKVLSGDELFLSKDSLQSVSKRPDSIDISYIAPAELKLRTEYEKSGQEKTDFIRNIPYQEEDIFLFPPVKGIILQKFNVSGKHFGIDIVTTPSEAVKSVAEGTVVFSSWTSDTGHTIMIQHQNNLISVYKHLSSRVKNIDEFVKTGEVIGIVGNSGELTDGPHLHFEIWQKGNPVNPEKLIQFKN